MTWDYPSWENLIKDWPVEVVSQRIFGRWQGDIGVVVRGGSKIGFAVIGYGSCSGCDALEACGGDKDAIEALNKQVQDGIRWFESPVLALEYLDRASGNDFWSYEDGFPEWLRETITGQVTDE